MNQFFNAFSSPHAVSRASIPDTIAVLKDVVMPTMAKGPLIDLVAHLSDGDSLSAS